MAFTPQEQEIIQYGLKNGKSQEDVTQAIANLRAGIKPTPAAPAPAAPAVPDLIKSGGAIPAIPAPFKSDPQTDGTVGTVLKTLGNLPTSSINLATGIVNFLNPVKNIVDTVKNVSETYKQLQDYSAQTGEHPLTILGKALTAPSGTKIPGTNLDNSMFASAAAKVVIPKFIQDISKGDFEAATKSIVEQPAEQIGTLLLVAKGVADKLGVGDQFDAAMQKVASPVETPLNNAFDAAKTMITGANGKAIEMPAQQPTPEQFAANPDQYNLFRGENGGNKGGLSTSTDPSWAKNFQGDNGQMISGNLPPGAKVKVLTGEDIKAISDEILQIPSTDPVWQNGNLDFQKFLNQRFFDKGYDAIVQNDPMASGKLEVIVKPDLMKSFEPVKIEALQEGLGSWKPGQRTQFDNALFNKDAATVKEMLPNIPPEYAQKFATEIKDLTGQKVPAIPPEIKVKPGEVAPEVKVETKPGDTQAGNTIFNKAGRQVSNIFIRPSEKTAKMVQDYEAGVSTINPITPADTAARLGIWGTDRQMGIKATETANDIFKNSIEPAVKSIKEPLKTKELMADLQKYVDAEKDLTRRASLQKALDKVKEDYKYKAQASYTNWQEVKSSIDSNTPQKAFTDNKTASAYKDIQHQLADDIRQRTYSKLADQNVKQDYLDYGNLLKIKGEGAKAMAANIGNRPSFTNMLSLAVDHSIQPITTGAGVLIYHAGDFNILTKVKIPDTVKTIGDYVKSLPKKVTLDDLMKQGVIILGEPDQSKK